MPKQLSILERHAARTILNRCNGSSQEILDVLQAIINAGEVRKSPLAVLGGLVRRWEAGTFDASPGLHIQIARQRRLENQARLEALKPTTTRAGPARKSRRIPPEALEVFRRLRRSGKGT